MSRTVEQSIARGAILLERERRVREALVSADYRFRDDRRERLFRLARLLSRLIGTRKGLGRWALKTGASYTVRPILGEREVLYSVEELSRKNVDSVYVERREAEDRARTLNVEELSRRIRARGGD